MKTFNVDDRVSFSGNVDHTEPIENTVIAWVDNATKQAIIEHEDGHDATEIPGKGLDPTKKYIFVNIDHLELIEKGETVETVVAEKESPGPTESPYHEVSKVLSVIKRDRPTEEHDIWDKVIALAMKEEKKIAAAKQKEISKQAAIEAKQKAKDKEDFDIANAEVFNENSAERLKAQKAERENIEKMIKIGVDKGFVKFDGLDIIIDGQVILQSRIDKDVDATDLALYFQNVTAEFTKFALDITHILEHGYNESKDEAEDEESTDNEEDKGTETEQTDDTGTEDAESGTADAESGPNPISKEAYEEKLVGLDGIGPATVKDIITVFTTNLDLIQGVADNKLSFNSKVDAAIKKAVKSGYFG